MDAMIEQFAKDHNLDKDALYSVTEYLVRNIKDNPELLQRFLMNPDKVLDEGVKAWYESSKQFHEELLAQETPRSNRWYNDIAIELYTKLPAMREVK